MKKGIHTSFLLMAVLGISLQVFSQYPESREEKALRNEISRHDELYFREHAPEISDREYDLLKQQLRNMGANPILPIGDDRSAAHEKAFHRTPMLSLAKANGRADILAFQERIHECSRAKPLRLVLEPKIDGMAMNLVYIKGRLVRAISRGNGREGDLLTQQVLQVGDVPEFLDNSGDALIPDYLEIRGEIYVEKEVFERMNRKRSLRGSPEYTTPRHYAAGSMRLKDPEEVGKRGLRLIAFDWGSWTPQASRPENHITFIEQARTWGFHVPESRVVASSCALEAAIERELERIRHSSMPCDGIVMKVDDNGLREHLGCSERAPNWAIACKFRPDSASSTVRDIALQVGRTGTVTPVAILDPVTIGQRTIQRINLHNPRFLTVMDIRVGDSVEVELSGDVIPIVRKVNKDARITSIVPYRFPGTCPFCGTEFAGDPESHAVHCPNYRCPERTRRRLLYFADIIGLHGLGPAGIGHLVDSGSVTSYVDLLHQDDAFLEIVKRAPLWKTIAALGIPGVGPGAARKLAESISSLEDLLDIDSLKTNSGEIPSVTSKAIVRYSRDAESRRDLTGLVQATLN